MFKRFKYLLAGFLILGVLVWRSGLSQAQTPNLVKIKSAPVELDIMSVYIPCEDPSDPICVEFPEGSTHPDPASLDHEILLNNGGFPPNTDVYIVGCINTPTGTKCTTGSTALDNQLNAIPGGDTMSRDASHQFKAAQNPVKSDADGDVSIIVRSYTPQITAHIFNAYYLEDQDLSVTTTSSDPFVTPEEALHLQNFNRSTPTPRPVKATKPRPVFRRERFQDPKGRTFDLVSLEPIPGAEATLLDSSKNFFEHYNITNPQIVKDNGEFNFWVPNGIYFLSFAKLPVTHQWPVELGRVHPNYSLAYFCDPDVKNDKQEPVPLYYDQFSIIEYNKLVHCDVPVDPGNNQPFRSEVKTIDYGLTKSANEAMYNYTGRVSHPFTKVELVGETTGTAVASVEADKFGYWKISLSGASYPLTEDGFPDKVVLKYTKKDLTGGSVYKPVVGVVFEPVLRYVEGFAYDKSGNVIVNARIGVKQTNADTVVYLASADARGFFRIGSQYLPSLPYELIFTDPDQNRSSVMSASQFLEGNKDYLSQRKLNLVTSENREPGMTISTVASFRSLNKDANVGNQAGEAGSGQTRSGSGNSPLFSLLFGLLVIGAVGILLFFRFSRKKANQVPPHNLI